MGDFTGRGAIVTGGASGIGRAVATILAERGAQVVIADRDGTPGEAAAAAINDALGKPPVVSAIRAELSQPDAVARMAADAENRLPSIDVLINGGRLAKGRILYAKVATPIVTDMARNEM